VFHSPVRVSELEDTVIVFGMVRWRPSSSVSTRILTLLRGVVQGDVWCVGLCRMIGVLSFINANSLDSSSPAAWINYINFRIDVVFICNERLMQKNNF